MSEYSFFSGVNKEGHWQTVLASTLQEVCDCTGERAKKIYDNAVVSSEYFTGLYFLIHEGYTYPWGQKFQMEVLLKCLKISKKFGGCIKIR